MKNLTVPIVGLHFLRHNSAVIDNFTSQRSAKPQAVLIHDSITIPQMTTKTITAFVDNLLEWNPTGTVKPVKKLTETASLMISHLISTINDRKKAVRLTNTTESPYAINKNTQIAEFSVVTPEQSKFIKGVDIAFLSMIPEGDPDLIIYLTELLRTNKQAQQTNTFWFPTPENPVNTEDHAPIQTLILKELRELQQKEKLNPKDDIEPRMEFLKRFAWTDTLLTETEKQAVQDILVDYHDILASQIVDIGMNTKLKVKLTPKDDKSVYSQNLPMPIHLKEDLIVELALKHKYGIITASTFSKYVPFLHRGNPTEKCVSLWISGKSTH